MPASTRDTRPSRVLSAQRATAALVAGAAVAAAVWGITRSWTSVPLVFWNVSAAALLAQVWVFAWRQDAAGTEKLAKQDAGRPISDGVVLTASLASLAAVIVGLVNGNNGDSATDILVVVLAATATLLGWAMVNTVFALKYARLYFGHHGGIDFNQDDPPTYVEFAYFAFTIGVSFAVSDNDISSTAVRRIALPHALLSYAYTTFVLAVSINLVTNLG